MSCAHLISNHLVRFVHFITKVALMDLYDKGYIILKSHVDLDELTHALVPC